MAGRLKRISIQYQNVTGALLSDAVNFIDVNVKGYFVFYLPVNATAYKVFGVYRSIRQCLKKGGLNNHRSSTGQTGQIVFYSPKAPGIIWQNANTGNNQQ